MLGSGQRVCQVRDDLLPRELAPGQQPLALLDELWVAGDTARWPAPESGELRRQECQHGYRTRKTIQQLFHCQPQLLMRQARRLARNELRDRLHNTCLVRFRKVIEERQPHEPVADVLHHRAITLFAPETPAHIRKMQR